MFSSIKLITEQELKIIHSKVKRKLIQLKNNNRLSAFSNSRQRLELKVGIWYTSRKSNSLIRSCPRKDHKGDLNGQVPSFPDLSRIFPLTSQRVHPLLILLLLSICTHTHINSQRLAQVCLFISEALMWFSLWLESGIMGKRMNYSSFHYTGAKGVYSSRQGF